MPSRTQFLAIPIVLFVACSTPIVIACCLPPEMLSPPQAPPPSILPGPGAAVVELLEDEASRLVPHLTNHPGNENGTAAPDWMQRYSGVGSLRVTPLQRYSHVIAGWDFPIADQPKPGEYRFIRFAWKKSGGSGIMLQLCGNNYHAIHRYHAGRNSVGWQSTELAEKAPAEWEVVTRDLFQDFGSFRLMGLAFTPMDGEAGWFDHIYLGRTMADLDRVALPVGPPLAVPHSRQVTLWRDLADRDAAASTAARWRLADESNVSFLREKLLERPEPPEPAEIARLIAGLDHVDFRVREASSRGLDKLGEPAVPELKRHLQAAASPEAAERIERILDRHGRGFKWTPERARTLRSIRALEQIGTAEARKVLEEVAVVVDGPIADESRAAVARMKK